MATTGSPAVQIGLAGVVLLVVTGILLPAVWSRDSARRADARALLRMLISS